MAKISSENKAIRKRFYEALILQISLEKNITDYVQAKHFVCDEILGISLSTLNRYLNSTCVNQVRLFPLNKQIKLNL